MIVSVCILFFSIKKIYNIRINPGHLGNVNNENSSSTLSLSLNLLPPVIEAIVNQNREANTINYDFVKNAFSKYLYPFIDFNNEPQDTEIIKQNNSQDKYISLQNAIKDTNYLFDNLKYSYAGYQYFGGDSAFLSAKNKIIQNLNKYYNEKISKTDYMAIIVINLDFIQDAHFSIGQQKTCISYKYLSNNEYILTKDKYGLYLFINDNKYYIEKINNASAIEKFIKPTITENGEIAYTFGIISANKNETIDVVLKSSIKELNKNIKLTYSEPVNFNKVGYKKYYKNGIPIIENRRMMPLNNNDELNDFVDEATAFKNNKISIIDIRGNSGGYSTFPMEWFKNVTGEYPYISNISCELKTMLTLKHKLAFCESNILADKEKIINEINTDIQNIKNHHINEGWGNILINKAKTYPNNSIIIVLLDNNIASSGDEFVNYLRLFTNVIFVGTNTMGAQLIAANNEWYLPNSGIKIFCGTILNRVN